MTGDRLFIFLRAVNLGRTNKVPMKPLMARIEAAGLGECSFLLQSGNLIFRGPTGDASRLKLATERIIRESFDVETAAISRSPQELEALLEANPFDPPEGGSVQIAMWDDEPDQAGLEELLSGDYGEDRLVPADRAAIVCYAGGSRNSKLSNSYMERKLRVPATSRNIRTLERLLRS